MLFWPLYPVKGTVRILQKVFEVTLQTKFPKLCKSLLIYHSRSLFAQYVWMTIFLFLLALGKCITLMGSKTNVVCCSVPYITLIIGKWSLVHKKQKTLPFENSIHVERNWYHMHAIIMIHRKVLIIIIHKKFSGV